MADYDCDFCDKRKCVRRYDESCCPYDKVSKYSKEKCKLIENKINNILKEVKELKSLDNEDMLDEYIDQLSFILEFQIKEYISEDIVKEWKNLNENYDI